MAAEPISNSVDCEEDEGGCPNRLFRSDHEVDKDDDYSVSLMTISFRGIAVTIYTYIKIY